MSRPTGPGTRLRDLGVYRGRAFHWSPGPGTERKLGSDGHKPDRGAGKILPLPHFLSRRLSERGKRWGLTPPPPPKATLVFPPGECSRAEGNGALGSFLGWDLLVLCGVGLLLGIVNSWVWGGRRGLPNYFGLSVLLGGLGLATLRFPTPSNLFPTPPPPPLGSILHL